MLTLNTDTPFPHTPRISQQEQSTAQSHFEPHHVNISPAAPAGLTLQRPVCWLS